MASDLRYAIRSFLKTPSFTLVILLTLALGIGANTAIFTVVNAVLLRPLPYPHADRLMRVARGTSFPDMRDWMDQASSFQSIGGFRPQAFDFTVAGADAERFDGALVTARLFDTLGASPLRGRLIDERDGRRGAEAVVVVSERFWRDRLAADANAIGRGISFNGASYTIAGIVPAGFQLPGTEADVYAAFDEASREAQSRGAHTLRAFVRLRGDVTRTQAQQDMDALAVRLERQYPDSNQEVRFRLVPLTESITGAIREPLLLLAATVGFVLLIACVNVANLLIARGAMRRGELAVRAALGAGRGRIVRQLLTESILLAASGGVVGLLFAWWITRAVVGLAPADVPRLDEATIDGRVLLFTALMCLVTGVLFGILPAWSATRTSLGQMSSASRTTAAGSRTRAALMVAEIALALVLLVGAGLLLRSFARLLDQPLGFNPQGLITANVTFSSPRYFDVATRGRTLEAFEEAIRGVPGVRGVALTTDLPIGGNPLFHNLAFEGRTMAPGTEPEVYYRGVNADYFSVMNIPLRRGRHFTRDDRGTAPLVAIVNDAFAREYYAADDPIGKRIRWASGDGEWITIVGVVADVRGLSLDRAEVPAVHMPYAQDRSSWRTWMDFGVRVDGDAAPVVAAMRRELARLDATVPLTKVSTLEQVIAKSTADRRFNLYLLGGFAALSLLLAAAGTYGVMAYAVTQRTRELGVRLALGARPVDVVRMILQNGFALSCAGVVLGLIGAAVLSRAMSGMLFEVRSVDPLTYAVAAVILLASALLAAYVPARRAGRVDPLIALRSE